VNPQPTAWRQWRKSHFDVVITDVHIPEMDGITLTGELTRRFSDLPVMIMTAQLDERSRELAIAAGAREVLRKPFAISELMARLQRILHVQESVREQRA
jgi:DNA-binding response OmpR family regulator